MTPRGILLMGTSPAHYHGPGEPPLGPLVAEQLTLRSSRYDWTVVSERLFFAPNMVERAIQLVDRHRPDAVVLVLDAGIQMMRESIEFSVKRRWPFLYPAFAALSRRAFALAGGRRRGRRPWGTRVLIAAPRRVAHALIGAATDVPQETVTLLQLRTMQMLVDRRVPFVCRLSMFPHVPDADAPWSQGYDTRAHAWRGAHTRAVVDFCERHQISFYDPIALSDGAYSLDADRVHPNLASRRLDAAAIAVRLMALADV